MYGHLSTLCGPITSDSRLESAWTTSPERVASLGAVKLVFDLRELEAGLIAMPEIVLAIDEIAGDNGSQQA